MSAEMPPCSLDGPADDDDKGGDRPEVPADPEDGSSDLLVGEGRKLHAGDVGVGRVPRDVRERC